MRLSVERTAGMCVEHYPQRALMAVGVENFSALSLRSIAACLGDKAAGHQVLIH
jgi:hypothetical protein